MNSFQFLHISLLKDIFMQSEIFRRLVKVRDCRLDNSVEYKQAIKSNINIASFIPKVQRIFKMQNTLQHGDANIY